ncbi:hypothetical protein [Natronosalvus rutilus]|uniref:Uncharacterized protein n=1 Tax=Natronosalvus rutilus TaxID=2953753 RepID=A0A9E7NB41_9EURY|nr:hypothetical protein [Natronosalvus rutilus]UTF53764.1 hypothetical protein NGM29_00285 [Natronosalvus rutilus]
MTVALASFQVGILVILLEALRRRDAAAATNALVSFAVTLLPAAVEYIAESGFGTSIAFGTDLPLWIAVAGFLHAVGMLGPYDSVWWWDHLTHLVSAALVAALVYAGFLVLTTTLGLWQIGLLTIGVTFVIGILWELLEILARRVGIRYDVEPVLVHYGWRDTAFDLVFDVLGALLVVLFDLQLFVPAADRSLEPRGVTVIGASVLVFAVALVVLALDARSGES